MYSVNVGQIAPQQNSNTQQANQGGADYAHFNPQELKVLDRAQGGPTFIPGTSIRHYAGLENNMPQMEGLLNKRYERFAKGGQPGEFMRQADEMRKRGRNGDSEIAVIGPRTRKVFNHLMNGGSINPVTKKCEYFGLGDFFSNMGSKISSGFNKAKDFIGSGVSKAKDFLGSPVGQRLTDTAKNAGMTGLGSVLSGKGIKESLGDAARAGAKDLKHSDNPFLRTAGSVAGSAMKGRDIRDTIGRGINAGTRGNENSLIRGAGEAAKSFGRGQGAREAISRGIQTGAGGFDHPAARGAEAAAKAFGKGRDLREVARRGINAGVRGHQNPMVRAAQGAANQYMQRGGMGNMIRSGMTGAGRAGPREEYTGANANDLYGEH